MRQVVSCAATAETEQPPVSIGLFVGFAGGLAEIMWISAYSASTDVKAAAVARGVAEAVGIGGGASAVLIGVAVHMALAGGLGIAVVAALQALPIRWHRWRINLALLLAALAGVWALNFLLILPVLSPGFVTMVPMPISFASKLMFGLAAFAAFEASASRVNRQS